VPPGVAVVVVVVWAGAVRGLPVVVGVVVVLLVVVEVGAAGSLVVVLLEPEDMAGDGVTCVCVGQGGGERGCGCCFACGVCEGGGWGGMGREGV